VKLPSEGVHIFILVRLSLFLFGNFDILRLHTYFGEINLELFIWRGYVLDTVPGIPVVLHLKYLVI
jgi:hypothetical protein